MKLQEKETATYIELEEQEKELEYKIIQSSEYLFEVLTKKYYSWKYAWLRELLSNAFDAHIAAGKKDTPIKVMLEPEVGIFNIRDYGTGIDPDKLEEVYLTFGNSTRRNSNKVIGYYGFGSKAPFMMTDAFKVIDYWNGKAYHCLALYTDKPRFIIEKVVSTSEPNGLEIEININYSEYSAIEAELKDYALLSDIPIDINGKETYKINSVYEINKIKFCKGVYGFFVRLSDTLKYQIATSLTGNISPIINFIHNFFGTHAIVFDGMTSKVKLPGNRDHIVNEKEIEGLIVERLKAIVSDIINDVILPKIWDEIQSKCRNLGHLGQFYRYYRISDLLDNLCEVRIADNNFEIIDLFKKYRILYGECHLATVNFNDTIGVIYYDAGFSKNSNIWYTFIPENFKDKNKFKRMTLRNLIKHYGPHVTKWREYNIPECSILWTREDKKEKINNAIAKLKELITGFEPPKYFEFYVPRESNNTKQKRKRRVKITETRFAACFYSNTRRSVIDISKDWNVVLTTYFWLLWEEVNLLKKKFGCNEVVAVDPVSYNKIRRSSYKDKFKYADKEIEKIIKQTKKKFERAKKTNPLLKSSSYDYDSKSFFFKNKVEKTNSAYIKKKFAKIINWFTEYGLFKKALFVKDLFDCAKSEDEHKIKELIFKELTGLDINVHRWTTWDDLADAAIFELLKRSPKAMKQFDPIKYFGIKE